MNEVKARPIVKLLMKHYEVPIFEPPTAKSTRIINSFYQAKYGLFTCYDSVNYIGLIDIDPSLVTYWERSPE